MNIFLQGVSTFFNFIFIFYFFFFFFFFFLIIGIPSFGEKKIFWYDWKKSCSHDLSATLLFSSVVEGNLPEPGVVFVVVVFVFVVPARAP